MNKRTSICVALSFLVCLFGASMLAMKEQSGKKVATRQTSGSGVQTERLSTCLRLAVKLGTAPLFILSSRYLLTKALPAFIYALAPEAHAGAVLGWCNEAYANNTMCPADCLSWDWAVAQSYTVPWSQP